MNESQISVRYAKALFQSALEKQQHDSVYADMQLVADTCKIQEFQYMLITPALQTSQKQKAAHAILEKRISGLSLSLIELVIKNRREIYLPGIARYYQDLYRQNMGIYTASLVTAQTVDEVAKKQIQEMIIKAFDSDVELSASVDNDIIGGFILTVEDKQYDASVSTSLKKIKKQLLQTSIEIE